MRPHVSIWLDLLDAEPRQRFVDVAGVRTRVLEAGEGPPLVFLHGTGGHLEAYTRNVAVLARHFRVIALDMLGHGYTGRPDYPYTIDRLSDHIIGTLDALGIDRVSLSGESLGGWVAAWTAAHHPDRVQRLVLNTPGNIRNKPEVMEKVRESSLRAVREPSFVRARIEWLFLDPSQVTDELVALRSTIYGRPGYERTMEHIVAVQDWETRRPYAWDPSWCGKIKAPTLLVWTDHDPTGGVDEAQLLLEWIPQSSLYVIENAGHWPQWEQPEEFNRLHVEFFAHGVVPTRVPLPR